MLGEWRVRTFGTSPGARRGLTHGGDWYSADYLAELLSGEDEDRVSVEDIHLLFDMIEAKQSKPCTACDGKGYTAHPTTHPTNPNMDGWDRRPCSCKENQP